MWTYRTAAAALSAHAVNAVKPASSSGAAKTIVKERECCLAKLHSHA